MSTPDSTPAAKGTSAPDSCCAPGDKCAAPAPTAPPAAKGGTRFRVPTMDCAAEESEIRRAVVEIPGIKGLNFQLRERTLGIDAPAEAVAQALVAIRKAGFDPQPVAEGAAPAHEDGDGHDHGHGAESGPWRLALALLLAIGAETIGFFAPDTQVWKGMGLAVAAVAIWMAGFDVYKKGLVALRHGRLNINALMTVAVTCLIRECR